MESTTNVNFAGVTPIIDDALQNDPFKTVEAFAGPGQHREDLAGFSNACSIHNASISKGETRGDNNTSQEESPTGKGNVIKAPERVRLGTDHIEAGDICDTTENTTGAAKESSNTENKAQSSSYNVQHRQAPQVDRFRLSTSVNCDRTDEHNTDTQPCQWRLSEVTIGIENCCFQTRSACFQTSTAEGVMDSYRGALVDCREWTVPVDADREVGEDSMCAHGSNRVSPLNDLDCSKTGGNSLDDVPQTQMRYLPNDENPTLGVGCSTGRDAGNSSGITKDTESLSILTADNNITAASTLSNSRVSISAASAETGKIYTTSTPEVKISAAAIKTDKIYISTPEIKISATSAETGKIYTTSTPEVKISATSAETDEIYTISTPEVKISAAAIETDKTYISTPEVNISAAARETDNSSTTSTPKVDISAHLAGDSRDVKNVQRNEIQDGSDIKISETSPDINDTEKTPLLENASKNPRSGCPQALVSNYLLKEANSFVNSENAGPGDYTIENALFLVRSYISELERVATNIERILQSDSSRLEMNKKGCSNCRVSHSCTEFEDKAQSDITGDNLETIAGNISLELSDQLAEAMSTASAKAVGVKEDNVRLGEDVYHQNEECKPEYVSTTRGEMPAQCSARCDAANFGLHGDQTRCSSVSSNSQIRGNESELPPHNVNNNSTCYVSANIDNNNSKHAVLTVNANVKNRRLSKNRKMCSIFYPVCADSRHVKGHRSYMNLTVNTRFKRVDTVYVNINNNGNTLSSTPRNIALSSETGSVPTAQVDTEQAGLKTRTQRFRNKLTSPGCDILVFEGSKVYSVTQKASNCKELVGKFVSDAGESKPKLDSSDKSQFGLVSTADTPLHGCQSVNKFAEINDGLARQCEKSGEHHDAQEVRQAGNNFDTYSLKIPDALRLPGNDKVQREHDVYLNNNNDDHANQISYSESKHNHSVNVVHDNFEMLKVDTLAGAKDQNVVHGCQLQPTRITGYEVEQARQNSKRAKTTKRSRNRAYMDNKHQCRKDKCANDSSPLDVVSSAQGGVLNTTGQIERGSSPLPVSCQHCCQTSATATLPRDNRWASALGSNENRSTDINQIEYHKKRNFPMRIRAASRHSQKDVYIPARTRRLTVESPAENLLVHTSYDRPNPRQLAGVFNIEMANRSNVLYLGAEEDYINTDGTRRLVCETECLSSKDPKTKHLVIENRALNVSYDDIHSMSEETKKSEENGVSVAAEEITRTRRELPEVVKNVSDKRIKWCGVSCARMIGDFVVIGTTKSIQSVVNMVHNQIQYSIPAGVNCETLNLPEAGDVGHNVPRQAAVCDRSRGGESGDHLAMAITDNDYINSNNNNNNNVCIQGTITGYNPTQRLHNKDQAPIHGRRHRNMASCVKRMPYGTYRLNYDFIYVTQTNFSLGSGADVNIYTVIKIIYQLRNKTMRIIYCRFCGLLLSSSTLATISYEANRNNSSARENNDWWENAPRHTNEASTETTDLNSEYTALVKDRECTLACSSCSISDQITQPDQHLELRDFMIQVEATDINPTTESQTCDSLQAPSNWHLYLHHSSGRLSLIEEADIFRQYKRVSCRNCTSCCELRSSAFTGEQGNQEIETQVQATDINPSNLAQTGKSLITIDSRRSSQVEIDKDWRAVSSNISVHLLHYEAQPELNPIDIFVTTSVEKNLLWTFNNSEHPQQVPVTSSETIPQSFNEKQHAGSYHSLEYTHYTELADENPVGTIFPRGLCGLEMQEGGLIWQNNSFVPHQELSVTRSGPDMSVYGHLQSELEFLMNDVDIFDSHRNTSQCQTNPTSYVQNTVDHESGGYRVASIPTSSMSLTVLDPAPVYDFTFTKDHWQARYRNRTQRGNSNHGRNVEETDESDAEDPAADQTVKDDKEVASPVGCNRQRSEDQHLFKRAKSSARCPFIIY